MRLSDDGTFAENERILVGIKPFSESDHSPLIPLMQCLLIIMNDAMRIHMYNNVPDDASNRIVDEKEEEEVNREQLRISNRGISRSRRNRD